MSTLTTTAMVDVDHVPCGGCGDLLCQHDDPCPGRQTDACGHRSALFCADCAPDQCHECATAWSRARTEVERPLLCLTCSGESIVPNGRKARDGSNDFDDCPTCRGTGWVAA